MEKKFIIYRLFLTLLSNSLSLVKYKHNRQFDLKHLYIQLPTLEWMLSLDLPSRSYEIFEFLKPRRGSVASTATNLGDLRT